MDNTRGAEGDNIECYLLVAMVNIHDKLCEQCLALSVSKSLAILNWFPTFKSNKI